jgi:hypothetical protein
VELSIKKKKFGMENKSDKERLLSLIESEILKKISIMMKKKK